MSTIHTASGALILLTTWRGKRNLWKRRWVTPACQVEVVTRRLAMKIRDWMGAARINYETGAGSMSGDNPRQVSTYFCMSESDAAEVRAAFKADLDRQRADFGLKDYIEEG